MMHGGRLRVMFSVMNRWRHQARAIMGSERAVAVYMLARTTWRKPWLGPSTRPRTT